MSIGKPKIQKNSSRVLKCLYKVHITFMQTWNIFEEKRSEKNYFKRSIKTAQMCNGDQFFYFL